jgi:hypothetical protein
MNDKKKSKTEEILETVHNRHDNIISDVNGSYTGVPLNGKEPVQDADDL